MVKIAHGNFLPIWRFEHALISYYGLKVSVHWSAPQEPHESQFRILSINFNTVAFTGPHRTNRLLENMARILGRATFSLCAALADDVIAEFRLVNDITRSERPHFRL